ncbi:hypothetical protein [Arthrobacter sp. NPDC056727]|uniref:hypothetical protein n=1 Tax=Arthrobacter sp. NPDC056727 TaxID=3345927 RepID=UPI00366CE914
MGKVACVIEVVFLIPEAGKLPRGLRPAFPTPLKTPPAFAQELIKNCSEQVRTMGLGDTFEQHAPLHGAPEARQRLGRRRIDRFGDAPLRLRQAGAIC